MQDFPSNSQKAKATDAPREQIKPVTSAATRGRKRGLGRQFKETFFAGSSREAFGYMTEEVVVPSLRDMFADALHSGIDRLIYGGSAASRRRSAASSPNPAGNVNYAGMMQTTAATTSAPQRTISRRSRAQHDFQDLVIPTLREANEVLDTMFEWVSRYGVISVAELYELCEIRPEHTDYKWGWTSIKGSKAVRLRQGGFLLDLPEPEPLG